MAAVASYASCSNWILRIEDLDTPRNSPGATDSILRTLDRIGFVWSKPALAQSTRIDAYRSAFETLLAKRLIYPCGCTRAEIADSNAGIDLSGERRYPGTCRNGLPPGRAARSWRMNASGPTIVFEDLIQGLITSDLYRDTGDYVLLRADGIFAYQLAVVVDDAFQGVTHVVRGADLLASTPRQIHLQRALGLRTPVYAHHPVVTGCDGAKLSKQNLAGPVDSMQPETALSMALSFLGHSPPQGLRCGELLEWARRNWDFTRVPRARSLPMPDASAVG